MPRGELEGRPASPNAVPLARKIRYEGCILRQNGGGLSLDGIVYLYGRLIAVLKRLERL